MHLRLVSLHASYASPVLLKCKQSLRFGFGMIIKKTPVQSMQAADKPSLQQLLAASVDISAAQLVCLTHGVHECAWLSMSSRNSS